MTTKKDIQNEIRYTRRLLAEIEKAVDAGCFDQSRSAIFEIQKISIPDLLSLVDSYERSRPIYSTQEAAR